MSALRRQLSLPYGIISRMAGNRASGSSVPGIGSHRLAESSTPSRAGITTPHRVSTSCRGSLSTRGSGNLVIAGESTGCPAAPTRTPVPCDDAVMDDLDFPL